MAIFQSNTLTVVDQTDNRKFEIYIKSNMPTAQIFNQNTGAYSPDWSSGLELTADIYLDSREMESYDKVSFQWSVDDGSSVTQVSTSRIYKITNNMLASKPILTYICVASYQNITATSKITFTRIDTGRNGTDGVDGTSVTILGSYETISALQTAHPTGNPGDAYIIGGRLYVWVINDARWEDVGQIQGPAGKDGAPAKLLALNGTSQVFKFNAGSTTPSPATIDVTAQRINISSTTTLTWTYNGSTEKPAYVAINGDKITITGKDMTVNSLVIKVSDGSVEDIFTIYKALDGANGNPGTPASFAFLTNENISFSANASGQVSLPPFTINVVAYNGATKVTPTLGTITGLPSGMAVAEPVTTANEQILTFTITDNSTLGSPSSNNGTITIPVISPVSTNLKLNWSKINTGATGTPGVSGSDAVTFQVYSSNGYALSINTPTVILQTLAYIGDVAITAGATYQWYVYNSSGWTTISGENNAYLTIGREDVAFSKSYMCKMTFNGVEYTSVVTVDDKNDENKVFTSKPSNYAAGDLWIVGVDYVPTGIEAGTLLKAEHTNTVYADADWTIATKYDDKIDSLQNNIDTYNQYFSFDSTNGVIISARDTNGTSSQFSTSLTNERLSFNYGNESIAYINGTKMNIKEAEIESPLTVTGKYSGSTMLQAPVINIGNFSIVVESNGSLSIVANI